MTILSTKDEVTETSEKEITELETSELGMLEAATAFVEALTSLFKVFQTFDTTFDGAMPKLIDNVVAFKRLYLGRTYAYNLLSRCRFLVKSPKVVKRVADITIWMFMHLPKRLILKWPSPKLRD